MDVVGRDVLIPGSAFAPPLSEPVRGYITKRTAPSLRWPEGRFEVQPLDSKLKYMWPIHNFESSWVLPTTTFASLPKTPLKRVPRTPKAPSSTAPATDGDFSGVDTDTGAPASTSKSPRGRRRRPSTTASPTKVTTAEPSGEKESTTPTADRPPRSPRSPRGRSPGHARSPRVRSPAPATGTKSLLRNPTRSSSGNRVSFKGVPAMQRFTEMPKLSAAQNLFNLVLMIAVSLPAVWLGHAVCTASPSDMALSKPVTLPPAQWEEVLDLQWWLRLGLNQPLVFVNLVFLLNVDVLFWLVALVQGTTWLIDPYWTLIPVMIHFFYQFHPWAVSDPWRSIAAGTLLRLWSVRLTYSYFRREEWQFGAREDWRFNDLSRKFGGHWVWLSFWATYITQHLMLVGITLPLYAVYTSAQPWGPVDTVATLMTAGGMVTSWIADNQLRHFMVMNSARLDHGLQPIPLLNTGLWYYSRHPNYFGEQCFWWGLSLFAVGLGHSWMVVGTLFNSLCMIAVTHMTEARMLARRSRSAEFIEYQRTTSCWVPWFKGELKHE